MDVAGLRVLFDDPRGAFPSATVEYAELIGVPTIVVVGRGPTDGSVEVKDGLSGGHDDIAIGDVVARMAA